MTISVNITCPGCKGETKVMARKPGVLSNSICQVRCSLCESTLLIRLQKPKFAYRQKDPDEAKQNAMVGVSVKVIRASKILVGLLQEEADLKAEVALEKEKALWTPQHQEPTPQEASP